MSTHPARSPRIAPATPATPATTGAGATPSNPVVASSLVQALVSALDQAALLQAVIEATDDALATLTPVRTAPDAPITDFVIDSVNPAAERLARRNASDLIGSRLSTLLGDITASPVGLAMHDVMTSGQPWRGEVRVHPRRLATSWLAVRVLPAGDRLIVTLRDIRADRREREALRRASLTDPLTGLNNRRGFEALAEQQLLVARRTSANLVLITLDCNGFKRINDMFGHQAGDRALRALARALRATVRSCDIVGRMGGDEFAVLALDADEQTAETIAQRLSARLSTTDVGLGGAGLVSVTLGHVVVRGADAHSLDALLDAADLVLYANKRARPVPAPPVESEAAAAIVGPPRGVRTQQRLTGTRTAT